MRTTIAKVTLTPEGYAFRWTIEGTVVARGHHTADAQTGSIQSALLSRKYWKEAFGSITNGDSLHASGKSLTRKLRLTTLGYDRDDRVIT
jgi:hypothetical protein